MRLEEKNELASTGPLAVVVIGNDALIEALPALPLQLAHACQAAGYHYVLPLSWGDELVAETVLRTIQDRPGEAAVLGACPLVRQRLLGTGSELTPMLVMPPAPPVALARYVRGLFGEHLGRLTYVGSCPAARSAEYDVVYSPQVFLALLGERGIDLLTQPAVFDSVLPPDRRRYASLPGGCPSPDALWHRGGQRTLVTLGPDDLPSELAQRLLEREPVLMDLAPAMGCSCSGVTHVVTHATTARNARIAVTSLEPPRSPSPVIEGDIPGSSEPPAGGSGPGEPPRNPTSGEEHAQHADAQSALDTGSSRTPPDTDPRGAHGTSPGPSATLAEASQMGAHGESERRRAPLAITPPRALRAVVAAPVPLLPRARPASRRPGAPIAHNLLS